MKNVPGLKFIQKLYLADTKVNEQQTMNKKQCLTDKSFNFFK